MKMKRKKVYKNAQIRQKKSRHTTTKAAATAKNNDDYGPTHTSMP